jgi:predicted GTPase
MNEVQINSILEQARKLKEVLNNPLAIKVLELDIKKESNDNRQLLSRLIRTLEQYVNKEKHLVYIGFLGHFSAGKSSTINSILQLWGSVHERKAEQNPTDKGITLITDNKNSEHLVLMSRETSNIPVRAELIAHPMLQNLVIADTPGTGDPLIVHELVEDFLPICDYILYFISGAIPIDNADLPILSQKTQDLPFIPIRFVITRADEFRIEKLQWVSETNLNKTKTDIFLGKLMSRLKEALQTDELSIDQFIFVDNDTNTQYNINELREDLLRSANELDHLQLAQMHGHKVQFFQKKFKDIKAYFLSLINEQVNQCNGFLKTATDNANRFDKSVEMNNEKLKELWSRSDSSLRVVLNEEKRAASDINDMRIASMLAVEKEVLVEKQNIQKAVESLATGYYGMIVSDVNTDLKTKIREAKQDILTNITVSNLAMSDISHLFPNHLAATTINPNIEIDFSKINEAIITLSATLNNILLHTKNLIRIKIHDLKKLAAKESLAQSLESQYISGRKHLNENFDKYFETIQMYKGAVLTTKNKEAIEKLRIGAPMDESDVQFTAEYMNETKLKAYEQVYISNVEGAAILRKSIEACLTKLAQLTQTLELVKTAEAVLGLTLDKEDVDATALILQVSTLKESIVNHLYKEQLNTALDQHSAAYGIYANEFSRLKKDRKKIVAIWTFSTGVAFLLIYLSLRYFNVLAPVTMLGAIALGAATNLLGYIAGYLYGRFKTDLKTAVESKKDAFIKKQTAEIVAMFSESFWHEVQQKLSDEKQQTDYALIRYRISEKVNPVVINLQAKKQEILDQLLTIDRACNALLLEYKQRMDNFHNKFISVFTDVENNLKKVSNITKEIREVSIKPSLDQIKEAATNLEEVKSKIKAIN